MCVCGHGRDGLCGWDPGIHLCVLSVHPVTGRVTLGEGWRVDLGNETLGGEGWRRRKERNMPGRVLRKKVKCPKSGSKSGHSRLFHWSPMPRLGTFNYLPVFPPLGRLRLPGAYWLKPHGR